MPSSSPYTALAGEFFTLGQLARLGLDATLTFGHTKSVDILVSNPVSGKMFRLEVKTTASAASSNKKMFGENYNWLMNEKHEHLQDPKLYYCFVLLRAASEMPKFFIVPSKLVAEYVKEENTMWLKAPHRRPVKKGPMRTFRIGTAQGSHGLPANKFENNWSLFKN